MGTLEVFTVLAMLLVVVYATVVLWQLHGIHMQLRYLARAAHRREALEHPAAEVEAPPAD